jgi:hypothetical protein
MMFSSTVKKVSLLLVMTFIFCSCASRLKTPAGVPEVAISDYEEAVAQRTHKTEVYDGLYNRLTIQATWLDTTLTDYALAYSARLAQWDETHYREEREKKVSQNAVSTEFFVSLYTPERKHAELNSIKNLWKIYLVVNGQRYEGKATKIKLLLSEIQVMHPHHNRWSVPYSITFPVATALVEGKPAILILTGAVGSAEVKFNQAAP